MVILATLTTAVFVRQLFGHWTFPWDFVGQYTATPPFVATTVGSGHFVSWSPFVASGFPVDVDPQVGMYYPLWWLFGVVGVTLNLTALTTIQVIHVFLGAAGMLALGRARRLEWRWATAAAVAYLFFGGFYGEAEHADIFRGFAYLPWLLWALTPPADSRRWTRLVAVPPLAWLIATGAYPGQLISFGLTGLVYVVVAVRSEGLWRRYRAVLLLSATASVATCVAVLTPYLLAQSDLIRHAPVTVAIRAAESLGPLDLLGLYLNNFAWTYDGTVASWAVGIPVIMGLTFLPLTSIRRHLPLVTAGAIALLLAMTPKIEFIGKAMIALGPLFPSRFPAADYKAVAAVALIVLSVEGWRSLSSRPHAWWQVLLASCVLAGAVFLAPSKYGPVTRAPWLLAVVVIGTATLALRRPPPRVMVALLILLVVVDGVREIRDYRLDGGISSWQTTPSTAAMARARDLYVTRLSTILSRPPTTRPARVPSWAPAPLGTPPIPSNPDASGWMGDGYRLIDYGGLIERPLYNALRNAAWESVLLAPWHAYLFPCTTVGCTSGAVRLPPPVRWRPSQDVTTISYGVNGIVYNVSVLQPTLMIENELAVKGWRASTPRVQIVNAGIPLRAWRLAPGHYHFTATYEQPGRSIQELAAVAALLAWLGSAVMLRRTPHSH